MSVGFWFRRCVTVLIGAFVVIGVVQLLKGHIASSAWLHAAIWAPITTGVYALAVLYHARRGRHCALCTDAPDGQAAGSGKTPSTDSA